MEPNAQPEAAISYRRLSPEELTNTLGEFKRALQTMSNDPPGKSTQLTAFANVAINFLDNPDKLPTFNEVVDGFLTDRFNDSAHYKVQLFWRVFQNQLIDTNHPKYPHEYTVEATWKNAFERLLSDPLSKEAIENDLLRRNVQSNIPERYAGLKLPMTIYRRLGVLPVRMSLVDAGCSAGLGQVQLEQNIPFVNINVEDKPSGIRSLVKQLLKEDMELSANVGFDSTAFNTRNFHDKTISTGDDAHWIDSNSYYPSELTRPAKIRRRSRLKKQISNFRTQWADLTVSDERLARIQSKAPDGQYDVAAALTVLYELSESERADAIENLASLARHFIFVQDFAEISKDDPTKLSFYKNIYAPESRYNAFVRLKSDPSNSWKHFATWNNGRCTELTPSAYMLELCTKISPEIATN